jgi:hypothetical protein
MGAKRLDLAGQRFGRLEALRSVSRPRIGTDGLQRGTKIQWFCRCDCGKEKYVNGGDLKLGKVHSCGCLRAEVMARTGSANAGRRKTRSARGGKASKSRDERARIMDEIFGIKVPRKIDRAPKQWADAQSAALDLCAVLAIPVATYQPSEAAV